MNNDELVENALRLAELAKNESTIVATYAEICYFLKAFSGQESAFLKGAESYEFTVKKSPSYASKLLQNLLYAFTDSVKSGIHRGVSPQRQAEIDVVSDFLEMALTLLDAKDVHPAAPAVLIGASLEEFLRNWIESEGLPLGHRKPSLESYSQTLREEGFLPKQDGKDITSWAGIRNAAAHGEWDEVGGKDRVRLMLEGVNLFMRKNVPG